MHGSVQKTWKFNVEWCLQLIRNVSFTLKIYLVVDDFVSAARKVVIHLVWWVKYRHFPEAKSKLIMKWDED